MKERTINRIRIATAVLVSFTIGAFCQTIDSLVVVPQNPTTSEDVSVHIYGWLWSSDVFIADINIFQGSYSYVLDLQCSAGGIGLPVLVPFDTIINFGMLAAFPTWSITVNTYLSGNQQETHSTQFAVTDPTGIRNFALNNEVANYPNPFIDRTNFIFSLGTTEWVELTVYDILGNQQVILVSQRLQPGAYDFPLDTRQFAPGKYFYQLRIGQKLITKPIYRAKG